MATTDLKLDETGSLPRPGPIGRLVRLAFGLVCIWYVFVLIAVSGDLMSGQGGIRPVVWNGVLIGLFLVSYIINIGYSRPWKKWPALISAGVFLAIAGIGYLTKGTVETELLARAVWGWEVYLFSHLGVAFVIAALIGTPGCEMRAFHDLYSRLTGIPTKEHYCPVGPLHPIDQWEAGRST
ncbi:MAG: hypothetical protein V3S70_00185 [Gammaproteobacteria bacterium]